MAALDFNIDALRCDTLTEKEELLAAEDTEGRSLIKFALHIKSVVPAFELRDTDPDPIPVQYNWSDWKLFVILRDYVQPNSTMTIDNAVDLTLDINSNDRDCIDVCPVVFEVAEQIPHHHTGHEKLARYLWSIGTSHKRIRRRPHPDKACSPTTIIRQLCQF
jgi:hypothetical protein